MQFLHKPEGDNYLFSMILRLLSGGKDLAKEEEKYIGKEVGEGRAIRTGIPTRIAGKTIRKIKEKEIR